MNPLALLNTWNKLYTDAKTALLRYATRLYRYYTLVHSVPKYKEHLYEILM